MFFIYFYSYPTITSESSATLINLPELPPKLKGMIELEEELKLLPAKEKSHAINTKEGLQSNQVHISNTTNHVCPSASLTQEEQLPYKKGHENSTHTSGK